MRSYRRAQASRVIGRAKRAPHWGGVQSRFRVIIYRIAGNFSEIETLTIFASRHENAKV